MTLLELVGAIILSLSKFFPVFKNDFLAAASILFVTAILAWLFLQLFSKVLEKIAAKSKNDIDDLIFSKTKKPIFYLILVGGLKLSVEYLGIDGFVSQLVASIMAIFFVVILLKIVEVILSFWSKVVAKRTNTPLDEVLLPILHKFSKVVFFIIAIMWLLNIWGIDITPYLAGVGLSGLVLGFALQDSLKNVFGGVSLLIDGAIKIGDKIRLESGEVGEVLDIGLRSTRMRTYDNELVVIPNGYLANSKVHNYVQPDPKARVYVEFGVEYGTKIEKVKKVVEAAINKMDGILENPKINVCFLSMGESALNFKVFFWVNSWKVSYSKKLEATKLIYEALNKAKINIPFPSRTVYLHKKSK